MTTDTAWLSTEEEQLWRAWAQVNAELTARLQRSLQDDSGLSMSDYGVLVHLTDCPNGRRRVSDLANLLQWERSRVSHHLTRMERRGLIQRDECLEDGRGAFIVVTPAGRLAIEQAAPGHVAAVRRLFLDALDPADLPALTAALGKVHARLAGSAA